MFVLRLFVLEDHVVWLKAVREQLPTAFPLIVDASAPAAIPTAVCNTYHVQSRRVKVRDRERCYLLRMPIIILVKSRSHRVILFTSARL